MPEIPKYYSVIHPSGRQIWFKDSAPQTSSFFGDRVACDKFATTRFLEGIGYQMPACRVYENSGQSEAFLEQYKTIVVKPRSGKKGVGITVDVRTSQELHAAVSLAEKDDTALLQEMLSGAEYRLLTVGGVFFAAVHRMPVELQGDGVSTVGELVNAHNQICGDRDLRPLDLDSIVRHLGSEGVKRVPSPGEIFSFSWMSSYALGGQAADVTEKVHESYQHFIEEVSQKLQLTICGFDFIIDDISKPMPERIPLLELNSAPGFYRHVNPTSGQSRNPAIALLDYLFGDSQHES